jgi:hypothetical protein
VGEELFRDRGTLSDGTKTSTEDVFTKEQTCPILSLFFCVESMAQGKMWLGKASTAWTAEMASARANALATSCLPTDHELRKVDSYGILMAHYLALHSE